MEIRISKKALTGTTTLGHGQKAKALRRSSAKTTWRAFALHVGQDQSGEKISAWKTTCEGSKLPHGVELRLSKKSPDWDDVESWTDCEGTSSEQCEDNVESLCSEWWARPVR